MYFVRLLSPISRPASGRLARTFLRPLWIQHRHCTYSIVRRSSSYLFVYRVMCFVHVSNQKFCFLASKAASQSTHSTGTGSRRSWREDVAPQLRKHFGNSGSTRRVLRTCFTTKYVQMSILPGSVDRCG